MAYKNIQDVMDKQKDLVEIVARFKPRQVKMAYWAGTKEEKIGSLLRQGG